MELPLPNGAYGYGGVGAIYAPGLSPIVEEWSASKSPYYTYGDPVVYKGLVYKLNYAWDGTTVGAPDSQVDVNGNRVWTLAIDAGSHEQYYDNLHLKDSSNWYFLTPCHTLFYTNYTYGGNTRTLFEHSLQRDSKPKPYYTGSGDIGSFSVDVGAALSIPSNLYKLVITNNAQNSSSTVGNLVGGIFEYLKDFPYTTAGDPLGTLLHETAITYTLAEKNWWMTPEYDDSIIPTLTVTFTVDGVTYNRTVNLWMIFVPETFLGRTYTGAYRVYRPYGSSTGMIERIELDTVTPDLITD